MHIFSIYLFLDFLGGGELMVVFLVFLLFFGSKNIPGLARSLGKGIRELKDATAGIQREIEKGASEIKKEVEGPVSSIKKEMEEPLSSIKNDIKKNLEE